MVDEAVILKIRHLKDINIGIDRHIAEANFQNIA